VIVKVGMVCPYTWDVPGGVQQHAKDLAEALIAAGHEVSVVAPCDCEPTIGHEYLVSAGRAIPVPYNGSVARLSFGFHSANRIRRWLREGDFDVLHLHEPAAPSLSLIAAWLADIPMVATFHMAIPRSRALSVASRTLQSALEKISVRIAVSEAARTTLIEHLGGDALLIPNGVAVSRYASASPLPGWPGRHFAGRGRSIGFLGRMDEPRKGLAILLKAFNVLAADRLDLRLLVAGPGDASEALARIAPQFRDRVTMLGMVSEADKIRALHSVDVFCAPNLGGESFGIVVAEAMAAGAPMLASDIDAFRPVVRNGLAGALFPVGDYEALAREAGSLLDDPWRRERLSAGAREAVRTYDWRHVVREVLAVYETVAVSRDRVVTLV
jgi:phosphatidyl-myo-inositol alpha-mannosyltransferase